MNLRLEFTRAGVGLAVTTVGAFYLTAAALVAAGVSVEQAGAVAIFIAGLWTLIAFETQRAEVADGE